MSLRTQAASGRRAFPGSWTLRGAPPAASARILPASWPRGWRVAAGLTAVAAGAAVIAGAFMPWVEVFAGLMQIPGVRGRNGQIMAAAGAVIAGAGLYQLVRGGQGARWLAGLAGFAAAGFSGYLLIQLARSMRVLGGDSMVIARGGPGLYVAATGSLAAFATLFFPPSSQATLRRDAQRPILAWAADRESSGIRRGLQLALGVIWLLDAALQYQPSMFTRAFPAMMLAPSATGEPAFVSGPVLMTSRLIASQVVQMNAVFATIQLALAAGLLCRATVRAALAGTIAWSLSVWWFGEGLGGIFGGTANPLTGAPGAAVLYAFAAVLVWPAGQRHAAASTAGTSVADSSVLGRWARPAWLVLWGAMAYLILHAPAGSTSLTAPGGTQATVVTIGFAAAFVFAAAGVFLPATTRPALLIAAAAALVVWVAGEDFGGILTGSATDPNTGPLLILLAAAFWPFARAAPAAAPGLPADSQPHEQAAPVPPVLKTAPAPDARSRATDTR
ncbi:MAG: hypothetical protein JO132_06470 [Streptosporangiaceae bacterium]|nr:hypothetical protein [Streptosporangiaceae bacterium]